MAKPTPYFDLLDNVWDRLEPHLLRTFTTQHFRQVVEIHAPEVWATFVERWGPGGKGSGNYYSPSNPLNNYLKDKVRKAELINAGFVDSTEGWGARWVNQWQFVEEGSPQPTEEDWAFLEGNQKWRLHLVRERHEGVRAALLKARRENGLVCDICGVTGEGYDDAFRDAMFEAHHSSAPLAAGVRTTRKEDVGLLCACCHRLLHRLISVSDRWITIDEAKVLLRR